jgi:hypothetical protein
MLSIGIVLLSLARNVSWFLMRILSRLCIKIGILRLLHHCFLVFLQSQLQRENEYKHVDLMSMNLLLWNDNIYFSLLVLSWFQREIHQLKISIFPTILLSLFLLFLLLCKVIIVTPNHHSVHDLVVKFVVHFG